MVSGRKRGTNSASHLSVLDVARGARMGRMRHFRGKQLAVPCELGCGREMFTITDYIAVAALLLSSIALYQTWRNRRGDLKVNAMRERSEVAAILADLDESLPQLKTKWNCIFGLSGMTASGMRVSKLQEIEQMVVTASALRSALTDVRPVGTEAELSKLFDLRVRANSIERWIVAEDAALAIEREGLRNRRS